MSKSEFIVPDSCALINKSNGTNCKYVFKLYVGALVSEYQTNQSSLKSMRTKTIFTSPTQVENFCFLLQEESIHLLKCLSENNF